MSGSTAIFTRLPLLFYPDSRVSILRIPYSRETYVSLLSLLAHHTTTSDRDETDESSGGGGSLTSLGSLRG